MDCVLFNHSNLKKKESRYKIQIDLIRIFFQAIYTFFFLKSYNTLLLKIEVKQFDLIIIKSYIVKENHISNSKKKEEKKKLGMSFGRYMSNLHFRECEFYWS